MTSNPYATAARRVLLEAEKSAEEHQTLPTPHQLMSGTIRKQLSKARSNAAEVLQEQFGLHPFDAETVARSAADLSQLREAARSPRSQRFGQIEITYIEFDVMMHRVLPSPENIRFEGERAWMGRSATRFESFAPSQPVLTMRVDDAQKFMQRLTADMGKIWLGNPHSRSIPMRGIENPGLLSIARVGLGELGKIGILESTDGFSRTVGALKGSGLGVHDVLVGLASDGAENRYRSELMELRDSGLADLDTEEGRLAAARLRSSIMPNARVIVGYGRVGSASGIGIDFHEVRRALVGHIHLEPPLKFSDTTQFALKANIALDAVAASGSLPKPAELTTGEMLSLLKGELKPSGELEDSDDELRGNLARDEVFLFASEALLSAASGNGSRVRTVNSAINNLTGKTPPKAERALLAADTALRVNAIADGLEQEDSEFKGKRSTLGRVLAATTLKDASSRVLDVEKLLEDAIGFIDARMKDFSNVDDSPSPAASTLGVLGAYCLVDGFEEPLLERSSARLSSGSYAPEPQQVLEKMVKSRQGLRQLAQVILDSRAGRRARMLSAGEPVGDEYKPSSEVVTKSALLQFVDGSIDEIFEEDGPVEILDGSLKRLGQQIDDLKSRLKEVEAVEDGQGRCLIAQQGADLGSYSALLLAINAQLEGWTRLAERRAKFELLNQVEKDGFEVFETDESDELEYNS